MEEQEDKRGFKVQDRRRFSAEGEAKPGGDDASSEALDIKSKPAPAAAEPSSKPQAAAAQSAASRQSSEPPPELTFAAFLWSLSEQALAALGEIPDPMSGKVTHDLVLAQQMIDIIIMLREKTRGNLDAEEQAMLKEILSGLQMKYVEMARQPNR
jgi:biotin carboxyl carrier protein